MAPFLIGLTGGIGTGKSTVARELSALGADVISGDELGREVLENSPTLLAQIQQRFGGDVFDAEGKLNRRALGQKVFSNPEDSRWLTRLTFPGIYKLWRDAVGNSTREVLVFDAALIFEWGIEDEFDLLLTVTADREQILRRLAAAGRWSPREIEARVNSQLPQALKARKAHQVLSNNDSLEDFRKNIHEWWVKNVEPELQQRRRGENARSV